MHYVIFGKVVDTVVKQETIDVSCRMWVKVTCRTLTRIEVRQIVFVRILYLENVRAL